MSQVLAASAVAASFAARYPNAPTAGVIDSISAGADSSKVDLQAGAVRSFSSPGKLVYVKVLTPFTAGIDNYLAEGDYLQVEEHDAKGLQHAGRAVIVPDEEVAAAQKGNKGK